MNQIKNVDHIITAKNYGGSARGYLKNMQQQLHRRGVAVTIKNMDAEPTGVPVEARIWQGQWIADCDCGSASFVDPDEPIFFCFGCGNRINDKKPRPVHFPPEAERLEIERLLLERPVDDMAGLTDNERAGMARPVLHVEDETGAVHPLVRAWEPGQTLEDLHNEQDVVIHNWKAGKHGL